VPIQGFYSKLSQLPPLGALKSCHVFPMGAYISNPVVSSRNQGILGCFRFQAFFLSHVVPVDMEFQEGFNPIVQRIAMIHLCKLNVPLGGGHLVRPEPFLDFPYIPFLRVHLTFDQSCNRAPVPHHIRVVITPNRFDVLVQKFFKIGVGEWSAVGLEVEVVVAVLVFYFGSPVFYPVFHAFPSQVCHEIWFWENLPGLTIEKILERLIKEKCKPKIILLTVIKYPKETLDNLLKKDNIVGILINHLI
jgi:hypothetical protein